jgi:hypothetical protein
MEGREQLDRAFGEVAALAGRARDRWWVIGSAAATLHGASAGTVRDIDLLMSVRDSAELLRGCGVAPRPGVPDGRFRSQVFGIVALRSLPLEVMGGLHLRTGRGWSRLRLRSRERMRVGDAELFVPAATELLRLFRRFGREKDLSRAASLEALAEEKG